MSTYAQPIKVLMKKFAATLQPGQHFTKAAATNWFEKHYPKVARGHIELNVELMTANSNSRGHFPLIRPGSGHDIFFKTGRGQFRLWKPSQDPAPKYANTPSGPTDQGAFLGRITPGAVYTRVELRRLFGIRDATLNNGVFPFPAQNEVWLFITEAKTADRTQYKDRLSGDILRWQGQTAGRTDRLIIEHAENGQRLLVFWRRQKYEFVGAGFRFEGEFGYVRHRGAHPTSFTLQRIGPRRALPDDQGDDKPFDPKNIKDGREKILRSIRVRRGQRKFRGLLLQAYNQKCAFSGCKVLSVLEAAHISPYMGKETNKVTNGLLLRADLHTLFDSGLISVEPDKLTILLDRTLMHSEYRGLHRKRIGQTRNKKQQPSRAALVAHRDKGLLKID